MSLAGGLNPRAYKGLVGGIDVIRRKDLKGPSAPRGAILPAPHVAVAAGLKLLLGAEAGIPASVVYRFPLVHRRLFRRTVYRGAYYAVALETERGVLWSLAAVGYSDAVARVVADVPVRLEPGRHGEAVSRYVAEVSGSIKGFERVVVVLLQVPPALAPVLLGVNSKPRRPWKSGEPPYIPGWATVNRVLEDVRGYGDASSLRDEERREPGVPRYEFIGVATSREVVTLLYLADAPVKATLEMRRLTELMGEAGGEEAEGGVGEEHSA